MSMLRLCASILLFCHAYAPATAYAQAEASPETRPLPELSSFLARVRDNLKSDRLLLSQYTYNMKTTTRHLDGQGRAKKTETREYEVFPSLDEDLTYERLISEDGRALGVGKLEEQDSKYKKKADARARKLAEKRKSHPEEQRAREAEENRKEQETIEEIFKLYEFALLRREIADGHSAVWIDFTPKAKYRPQTKDGELLKKLRGRALISETDYQVIRVDVELIDDLSFGLGLLARVHKGAKLAFARQKVNSEIWLPVEAKFAASARALLLKQWRVEATSVYSNYRKFTVSSTYDFMGGKPAQ